jgi:thioredoxin-related protein
MKRKILFSVFLLVTAVAIFALVPVNKNTPKDIPAIVTEGSGIKFVEPNWTKALEIAKKQNKLIFLDAYTTWCGPCRMLKNNTFPDKAAGEYFNKNFINIALDMEKGDGIAVAEKYRINAYPTLIIADGNGNVITYSQGYIDAKQLIEFGKFGISKKP